MISINILFPSEKKRIIREISEEIKKQYNKNVKNTKFNHVGNKKVYLYVFLEDDTPLYITADIDRIADTMTISDDMSFWWRELSRPPWIVFL